MAAPRAEGVCAAADEIAASIAAMAIETRTLFVRRRGREGLRVLFDHLLDVLLKADQHLLLDVDVEVNLDRLVGGLDRDAAGERQHRGDAPRKPHGFPLNSRHFAPPGGGDVVVALLGSVAGWSCLVVLSTSTFSAGESIGNGITGAITCVGSFN